MSKTAQNAIPIGVVSPPLFSQDETSVAGDLWGEHNEKRSQFVSRQQATRGQQTAGVRQDGARVLHGGGTGVHQDGREPQYGGGRVQQDGGGRVSQDGGGRVHQDGGDRVHQDGGGRVKQTGVSSPKEEAQVQQNGDSRVPQDGRVPQGGEVPHVDRVPEDGGVSAQQERSARVLQQQQQQGGVRVARKVATSSSSQLNLPPSAKGEYSFRLAQVTINVHRKESCELGFL